MATVFFTGFEADSTAELRNTAGTTSFSSSVTRGAWSAYALRVNPVTTNGGSARLGALLTTGAFTNLSNSTALYLRFYFRYDTKPASNDEVICNFGAAVTTAVGSDLEVRLNSSGNLAVYSSGTPTLLATGSTTLSSGTWYRVEVKADQSDAANTVWEVKVDGTSQGSGSFTIVNSIVAAHLGKVFNRNGNSVDFFYDDALLSNSAYPGAGQCKVMVPAGDGSSANGTANGAANRWDCVKEIPHDSDTTYVNAIGASGTAATYTLTASGASSGDTINSVKGVHFTRRDGGTNGNVKLRVHSSSSNSDSSGQATTASYVITQRILDADPATSVAWTQSGVDAAEVGVVENSANASRVTAAYLMVDYTPAGGTAYTQSLTGTITPSATLTKSDSKSLTGSVAPSGSLVKLDDKTLTDTVTLSGSMVNQCGKGLTGSLAPSGSLARQDNKALTGTVISDGSLQRTADKALAGTLTASGTLARVVGKVLTGTLALTSSLAKLAMLVFTELLTWSGVLTRELPKAPPLVLDSIALARIRSDTVSSVRIQADMVALSRTVVDSVDIKRTSSDTEGFTRTLDDGVDFGA